MLSIEGAALSDAGLSHLRRLRTLKDVTLLRPDVSKVTEDGLAGLASLVNLEELHLGVPDGYDGALIHLAALHKLSKLHLAGGSVTDSAVAPLAGLRNLKELDLSFTDVTDVGLNHVGRLARLTALNLAHADGVNDAGVAALANLTNTVRLDLEHTGVTAQGLEHLTRLGQLKVLDVSETSIGDEAIPTLVRFVGLEDLNVRDTRVTSRGLGELKRSQLSAKIASELGLSRWRPGSAEDPPPRLRGSHP